LRPEPARAKWGEVRRDPDKAGAGARASLAAAGGGGGGGTARASLRPASPFGFTVSLASSAEQSPTPSTVSPGEKGADGSSTGNWLGRLEKLTAVHNQQRRSVDTRRKVPASPTFPDTGRADLVSGDGLWTQPPDLAASSPKLAASKALSDQAAERREECTDANPHKSQLERYAKVLRKHSVELDRLQAAHEALRQEHEQLLAEWRAEWRSECLVEPKAITTRRPVFIEPDEPPSSAVADCGSVTKSVTAVGCRGWGQPRKVASPRQRSPERGGAPAEATWAPEAPGPFPEEMQKIHMDMKELDGRMRSSSLITHALDTLQAQQKQKMVRMHRDMYPDALDEVDELEDMESSSELEWPLEGSKAEGERKMEERHGELFREFDGLESMHGEPRQSFMGACYGASVPAALGSAAIGAGVRFASGRRKASEQSPRGAMEKIHLDMQELDGRLRSRSQVTHALDTLNAEQLRKIDALNRRMPEEIEELESTEVHSTLPHEFDDLESVPRLSRGVQGSGETAQRFEAKCTSKASDVRRDLRAAFDEVEDSGTPTGSCTEPAAEESFSINGASFSPVPGAGRDAEGTRAATPGIGLCASGGAVPGEAQRIESEMRDLNARLKSRSSVAQTLDELQAEQKKKMARLRGSVPHEAELDELKAMHRRLQTEADVVGVATAKDAWPSLGERGSELTALDRYSGLWGADPEAELQRNMDELREGSPFEIGGALHSGQREPGPFAAGPSFDGGKAGSSGWAYSDPSPLLQVERQMKELSGRLQSKSLVAQSLDILQAEQMLKIEKALDDNIPLSEIGSPSTHIRDPREIESPRTLMSASTSTRKWPSSRPATSGASSRGGSPSQGQTSSLCREAPPADLYKVSKPLLELSLGAQAQARTLRTVELALTRGASPATWKGPGTPLRAGVDAQSVPFVQVLLKARGDPNEDGPLGTRLLHLAAASGQEEMCRSLLEARADSNTVDCHGQTPLFFAPSPAICEELLAQRADINVVSLGGQTAMHAAATAGHSHTLLWLAKRSSQALVGVRDARGVSALEYAKLGGVGPEVLEALKRAGEPTSPSKTRTGRGAGADGTSAGAASPTSARSTGPRGHAQPQPASPPSRTPLRTSAPAARPSQQLQDGEVMAL